MAPVQHGMAVWANRPQVPYRVYLVLATSMSNLAQVVDMDELPAQLAISLLEVK